MQPYFFPYLGYFSLIKNTDEFILFDTVQFINHGWIERNRILKPQDGWQYIAVPLEKHPQKTIIMDIKIRNSFDWREQILRQLEHYKKRAPFYAETVDVIKEGIGIDSDSITRLNYHALKIVCSYLGIARPMNIFSEMDLKIEQASAPDEWALNICRAKGNVDEYWNPEGGAEFFDRSKYTSSGIGIKFQKMNLRTYSQRRGCFEPGLSIIDVMMFNKPEDVLTLMDDYQLI